MARCDRLPFLKELQLPDVAVDEAPTPPGSLPSRALSPALVQRPLTCAVKRRRFSAGAIPARQQSLQLVAIGAVEEVTNPLKHFGVEDCHWAVWRAGRPERE